MRGRRWLGLGGWLVVVFAAAAVGGQFTPGEWYAQLDKPPWTPPGWLFGPVWTVLYAMIAVAAWLVWKDNGFAGAKLGMTLFAAQLVLNAAWSWFFFGLRRPDLALLDIALLWATILGMLIAFWRVRPLAGWLLLPYLAWVTFAAALNFEIWRLN